MGEAPLQRKKHDWTLADNLDAESAGNISANAYDEQPLILLKLRQPCCSA
jgi:hypothetical protein